MTTPADEHTPDPPSEAAPTNRRARRRARRRSLPWWRRTLRGLGFTLAGLTAAVLGLVALLLYSPGFDRFAFTRGVAIYDGMIPGGASIEGVDGALARGLELRGVELRDRTGRALVSVDRLALRIDVPLALRGTVTVGVIELEGATVTLPGDDQGGFGDLAPESDAPPEPEEPPGPYTGIGPDFPVVLEAGLDATDVRLLREVTAGPDADDAAPALEEMVHLRELSLRASAEGRQAEATLALDVGVPVAGGLDVSSFDLAARWDSPTVRLDQLVVRSNWGDIDLAPTVFDVGALAGELESLRVEADPTWFTDTTTLDAAGAPTVQLEAEGDPRRAQLDLHAQVPELADARLALDARFAPPVEPFDVGLALDATVAPRRFVDSLRAEQASLAVRLAAAGDPEGVISLRGEVACIDCDPTGRPTLIELSATAAPDTKTAHADVMIWVADATVRAHADIDDGNHVGLSAAVDAPHLGQIADVIATFVPRPDLAGSADLDVDCAGTLEPRDLECDVNGGVDHGAPVERAKVDLTANLVGDQLTAEIRALDARAQGATIQTSSRLGTSGGAREPARVTVDLSQPVPKVEIEGLAIDVDTGTGGAGVAISGELDPEGESDLRVALRDVNLAAANSFVPGLGLGGRLDGTVEVRGPGDGPTVDVHIRGRGLRYQGKPVGTLDVDAHHSPERGETRAQVRLVDGPLGTLDATARLPLDLDLEHRDIGPRDEPWDFELHIRDANVAELVALAPAPEPIPAQGRFDLDLVVRGGGRPRANLELAARELAYDDNPLGALELTASYAPRELVAALDVHHPDVDAVRVDATVPLSLDLSLTHPGGRWRARDDHRAAVMVRGADLRTVQRWAPDVHVEGELNLAVSASGGMDAPELGTRAGLTGLRYDDKEVGDVQIAVDYVPARAQVLLSVDAQSPLARTLEVRASAPVRLAPADSRQPFEWRPGDPHTLDVGIAGADLAAARPWAPDLPELDGRALVDLSLRGNAHAPELEVHVAVSDFEWDGQVVGDIGLDARYADAMAGVDLTARHDATRDIELHATAPVFVDPARGEFEWKKLEPHTLTLDVHHLDPEFLAAFAELPEEFDFAVDFDLDARGNAEDFDVDGLLDGELVFAETRQPLAGKLKVLPDDQSFDLELGGGPSGSLNLHTRAGVPLVALAEGREGVDPLDSKIELDFQTDDLRLELFSPLLPPSLYELEGGFSSEVDVAGTLGTPSFGGEAHLDEGGITVTAMRQRFDQIEVDLDFDQNGAKLERFDLVAGQGTLELDGDVKLSQGAVDAHIELVTDDLPFEQPGIPRMAIDTKVVTDATIARGDTTVKVDIQGTRVDVKGTNVAAPKAIPATARVVYVDLDEAAVRAELGAALPSDAELTQVAGEAETEEAGDGADDAADDATDAGQAAAEAVDAPAPPSRLALDVKFSEPLEVRGPAIDMSWDGGVTVKMGPEGNATTGSLDLQEGTFDLLSNEFRVKRGVVTIPPGEDVIPFIDLEATTSIDEYEITALIRGRVTRPEFKLTSVPAADEATIFGMLVSGTSTPDDGPQAAKQAASILAAFSSPALQRQLNDKLKVDKVGLTFGETAAQPILSVGKNLSRKVYVETRYQFGADPSDPTKNKAELGLRYRFKPRWTFETYFGDAPAGGAGVFWGNAYDIERKPYWIPPPDERRRRRRRDEDDASAEGTEPTRREEAPSDGADDASR